MKPSQSLIDVLSKAFGEKNMSNIVADFEPVGADILSKINGGMKQTVADALFLSFCQGMLVPMNPASQFNRNYNNGHTEGLGGGEPGPVPYTVSG